jgi:hypothetical protein
MALSKKKSLFPMFIKRLKKIKKKLNLLLTCLVNLVKCKTQMRCGNSSVVEHNLAKVGVASSSLVSRSSSRRQKSSRFFFAAGWQSGYAAACKAVDAGSIPASAFRLLVCPGGETGRRKGLKIPRD